MADGSVTRQEIDEIPAVLRQSAQRQAEACSNVLRALAGRRPRLLATIGRGSSDHAATFLRYAFELSLGVPSASLSPSIASIYGKQLALDNTLCLAISQSGRSPDIVSTAEMAKRGGALVVAVVNDTTSPLAQGADVVLPIGAGQETAVAATKSFMGAAAAGLRLVASVCESAALDRSLERLPDLLEHIGEREAFDLTDVLAAKTAFVVGRGPSLGIAQEAALKLKEVVQFPAEAYSSAEVLHGPWQLGQTDCGLIGWKTDSTAKPGQADVVAAYRKLGRPVLDLQNVGSSFSNGIDDLIAPLLPLPSFYRAVVDAASRANLDPDNPILLRKVTETR